jgi:outer membrane lipoprotein LolB
VVTRFRAVAAAALALLAACASPSRAPGGAEPLSGRLVIKVAASEQGQAQSHSASFELAGDEREGQLRLMGPLGTQAALASWDATGATLQDGQGTRRFADLAALADEALGEPVPLGALLHWLQGRPWAGAPHRPLDGGTGFVQLGWAVDLAQWADAALVEARRVDPPGVTVRAKLDRGP